MRRNSKFAPRDRQTGLPGLPGREIVRLMRAHRVTIRDLATRMQIAPSRVRRHREHGITFPASLDVWQAVTGAERLDPRHRAQLRQWHLICASGDKDRSFADQDFCDTFRGYFRR
jgi:hypothetical protein